MIKREFTNKVRFVLDELIPPFIRDSYWFMFPFFYLVYKGKDIKRKMHFKSLVYGMTDKEYQDFYNEIDTISSKRNSDLSESNIRYLLNNIDDSPESIMDVGCGKGYLLNCIKKISPGSKLFGVDVQNRLRFEHIEFTEGNITSLPFADNSFDTVICTHTIEHIVSLQQAVDELVRITRKKLIIVTPCQRYFYYTLDGHISFFYKQAELIRYLPFKKYSCIKLEMDWIYVGNKND